MKNSRRLVSLVCVLQPLFQKEYSWFKGMEGWVEQGRVLQDRLGTQVVDGAKTNVGVREFCRSGGLF